MKKKNILALVAIAITITAIFAPLVPTALADHVDDPNDWYMSVDGVLDTDYYLLYPYEDGRIGIGLSKFGEMIDAKHTTNPENFARGLNYSKTRDPFANEGIPDIYWLQGWFADIRYIHRVYGARHVWAMATFADLVDSGGDWLTGHTDPYGAPHGGRKTSAFAETDPMTVIYDGPRKFIGVSTNHLYDTILGVSFPLVDVKLTFIFNKVKKEVIVLKDIKLTIDQKILEAPVDVQFSNRAEWDLGPSPDWKSFAHFYHQNFTTCYGSDWTLAKTIMREHRYINQSFQGNTLNLDLVTNSEPVYSDPGDPAYDTPIVLRSEYIYINDEWLTPDTDYTLNYNTGLITFVDDYPAQTKVEAFFKLYKYDDDVDFTGDGDPDPISADPLETPHLYDVAQIISRDLQYVGWAAFWPVLSDYSVDAWDRALEPLLAVDEPDMLPVGVGEPDIPFVVGEWDFMLDLDTGTPEWGEQFRGVSVYGVTDYNDAKDDQMQGSPGNVIDREVQYQLDEVFVPWALKDAVHKATRSWVEWTTGPSWTSDFRPVVDVSDNDWNQYAVFSERVIDYTTGQLLNRYDGDYDFSVDSDGFAHITGLLGSHTYKILYHTLPNVTDSIDSDWFVLENDTATAFNSDNEVENIAIGNWIGYLTWEDNLGVEYYFDAEAAGFTVTTGNNDTNWSGSWTVGKSWYEDDFKVFLDDIYNGSQPWGLPAQWVNLTTYDSNDNATFTFDVDTIRKSVTHTEDQSVIWPLPKETVHVKELNLWYDFRVTVTNVANGTHHNTTVALEIRLRADYWTQLGGRYEWTVVGRDSAAVDSAGAALVTAAYKNKQVEIGLAGSDMFNPVVANQMPWVMAKMDEGNIWADYIDTLGRAALRDDWCKAGTVSGDEWPVASSNMIGVGGPLANGLAYYGNDFTNAFFGLDAYTPLPLYMSKIISPTCWNKNTYQSDSLTGYAVVSTYLDINGTVLFLVWGNWGRDTYYATKWFHEEGIYQLQEAPEHLTDIVLKIQYESTSEGYKPKSISIVESLGTISETEWVHGLEHKGDIHPDP